MRVLILSYLYAPMISPRAFRWSAIADHWARQGIDVDVVCSWRPCLLRDELLGSIHINRVGGCISEALRSWLKKTETHVDQEPEHLARLTGSIIGRKFARFVKWVHDRTWKRIYWPDYACLWYFPALHRARALNRQRHYNAVVTVSLPFTAHMIGLALKRKDPELYWLADSGDPFCFLDATPTNNRWLYRCLNFAIERKVFSRADVLTVTTKATRDRYASLFPNSSARLNVISPMLVEEENAASEPPFFRDDEKIRLLYVGTLYKKIRDPIPLLALFSKLQQTRLGSNLELHFLGSVHDCMAYFEPHRKVLGKSLFVHGVVSHEAAMQAMKEANILVNIGNNTPYQLPSKVVDYIAAGKPILNVARKKNDSSAAFLSQYPGTLCVTVNDHENWRGEDIEAITRFLKFPPTIEPSQIEKHTRCFRATSIASQYLELLSPSMRHQRTWWTHNGCSW